MPTSSGYDYLASAYEDDTAGIDLNELDDLRAQYLDEQLKNEIASIQNNPWLGLNSDQKQALVRQKQDEFTQAKSRLDYGKRNRDAVKRAKEAATRVQERERDVAAGNIYGDSFYNRPTPERARFRTEREAGVAQSRAQEARNRSEAEAFAKRAADPGARWEMAGRDPNKEIIYVPPKASYVAPRAEAENTDYLGNARYTGTRGTGHSSQEMFDTQKIRDRFAGQLWDDGGGDAYDKSARLYRSGVSPNAVWGESQRRHEDEQKRRRVQRLQGQQMSRTTRLNPRTGVPESFDTGRPLTETEIEYA